MTEDNENGDDERSPTAPASDVATPTSNPATQTASHSLTAAVTALTSPTLDPARKGERYELLGEHGRGGLGRVSRARDRDLDRDVAVKELLTRNHVSEIRFFREALITARLEHPSIVPVHEAGRRPDGTPFYAMKLVAGRPLRDLIAERHTTDERLKLLHHVIAVAEAIAYAHDRHIIHRDLKPANVIVGDFGETIVIDWGLAKDLSTSEDPINASDSRRVPVHHDLTSTGSVLGTPAYMAPEQERGEIVDQRADVFAIGAMLWELCALSKVPPLELKTRHRLLRRARIDPDLITILDKCLAKDPERRYPDAGALADDLKAFKAGARIAARRYSLLAMLVHWTRRHRALATGGILLISLAILLSTLYVRNIATERNLADQARAEAVKERGMADRERDRAQMSEAAVWLDKDPTHAVDLLSAIRGTTPQRALLLSEAEDRAASRVIHVDSRVARMQVDSTTHEAAIVTNNGTLYYLDIGRGTVHIADHDLNSPLVRHHGRWCYVTQTREDAVLSEGCGTTAPLGKLLRTATSQLLSVQDDLYVLEAGELSRFSPTSLTLERQHIKGFDASNVLSLICTDAKGLYIIRKGRKVLTSSCVDNDSDAPLAVHGEHYAALTKQDELLTDHGVIHLSSNIRSEFAIAMGDDGEIALADFAGEAWIVPAQGAQAERAALRAAHPTATSVSGSFAAFGYSDGAVIVFDTRSHQTWTFIGHASPVIDVRIDDHRVVSTAGDEIRIWPLHPPALQTAVALPCRPFHIVPTHLANEYTLDCSDGSVSKWTIGNEHVHPIHRHHDLAFGVVNWHEQVCTGGWDKRVLCTPVEGGTTKEFLQAAERIKWLVACEDRGLFIATADGAIWQSSGQPHLLYKHAAPAYRLAVDASCGQLASVAHDGSLVVYDLVNNRIVAQASHAHAGPIVSVEFQTDSIVTAGNDAKVKYWHLGKEIELSNETPTSGPVSKFRILDDGWVAGVNEQTVSLHSGTTRTTIELVVAHPIADITTSADRRYIAIATLDEIVILDQKQNTLATVHRPSSDINCLQFISKTKIAACDTNSILILDIDLLNFIPLFSKSPS